MTQNAPQDIPVFLFTGFLDAGKSSFIRENAFQDPGFMNGEKTLVLLCEEGEEAFDADELKKQNVFVELMENESDLTQKVLGYLLEKHEAKRVIIEYNGMWQLGSFYQNMPEEWAVFQEFFIADGSTFLTYNANMRSLVVDKLQSCEMVVFNRCPKDIEKMELHKIVRGSSRRAQIAYEYVDGTIEQDDIEDPLPFDMDAPVVTVADEDFALWYRDVTEEPQKWIGKVCEVKGVAVTNPRFDPGVFAFGRKIMTCCVEDIQYCSLVTLGSVLQPVESQTWYKAKVKIDFKFHKLYGRKGPVLTVQSLQRAEVPEQEVATFF